MKHRPLTHSLFIAFYCSPLIALAAPGYTDNTPGTTVTDIAAPSPTDDSGSVSGVDISTVLNYLHKGDIPRARVELSRLQRENPSWVPPVTLQQALDISDKSQADRDYLALMAELAATPENKRSQIPLQRLELATKELRLRKNGQHAMVLGWIYFERRDYAAAEQLFAQAGQWGEADQSKQARGLVSLRRALQAVAANDHEAALQHAEQAAALGNANSYTSTGWMLFKKKAYEDAFKAFSLAPSSKEKEQALAETCLQQSQLALAAGKDAVALETAECSQQHGHSNALTTLGWSLYNDGHYTRASRFFGTQKPSSEESRYGQILSLRASGETEQAGNLACSNSQTSQRIKALCTELRSEQMLSDYQAGRHDAVLRQADELTQDGKLNNDMQSLVAWSELSTGSYDSAAKRFDKLLARQPQVSSHAHGLMESLAHSDKPEALAEARARHPLLDNLLSQQAAATETPPPTKPAVNRPQPNPSVGTPIDENLLSQALEYYHAEKYEKAYKLLQQLHPAIIANRDTGLLTLSGWAAYHTGNYQQARDDFLQAAEWKDEPGIWLMLVEAEIALHNLPRAREITDGLPASSERDQMRQRLTALEAHEAYRNKDYARAEALLSSPDAAINDDNLEMLGWSRYQQGKYTSAAAAFEAAYRIKPNLARAKGLSFSYMHQHQPGKLITLADKLQGPLSELTADQGVRNKLREGEEDWINVNPEGVLIVQEPPRKISVLTRALQKLEGIPGFTWGSVDYNFVDKQTHVSFLVNQGIDWLVLPGDITLNTFVEYRSIDNDWQSVYDEDEFAVGLELQRAPFNVGIEHLPAEWNSKEQTRDITTAYLSWYHSWYKYLRRRHSKVSNPLNVNAYTGSTYGRVSHELHDGGGATARGFIRQGMDWFTSITDVGELTLNTYAAYRFRFRSKKNYWYDAHGPAVGIELQRPPFALGADYMWQINPRRDTAEAVYGVYLTWYYDWNLKPE